MCAIWEGYILNPPARGWSSHSRRPLPTSIRRRRLPVVVCPVVVCHPASRPALSRPVICCLLPAVCCLSSSCCRPVAVLLPSCRLLSSGVCCRLASVVQLSSSACRLSPGLVCHRLAAASLRGSFLHLPGFPIHPSQISLTTVHLCLLSEIVAILNFCLESLTSRLKRGKLFLFFNATFL